MSVWILGAAMALSTAAASVAPPKLEVASASDVASDFGSSVVASPGDLLTVRAGAAPTYQAVSDQVLSATNSGNSVNAGVVGSGQIGFANGALSGFSGVGNFVLNTGHNNNLQGAITINVVVPGSK